MASPGLMIVLEGSDGSGKATQLSLLAERLKAAGYDVAVFDFPRYQHGSSHFIKEYLSGAYGPAAEVSPYTASLFYALDRYEAAKQIRHELKDGKIVLVDRYVGSNMAHQGAKFSDPVEQRGFFVWEDNLEYQLLDIPRPDINIFLRVPAKTSAKLINQRAGSDTKRDQHESNLEHLKKSVATYDLLCELFPKDFTAVECTNDGRLLSIPQISNLIWKKVKPLLPPEPPHSGHAAVVSLGGAGRPTKPTETEALGDDKLVQKFKDTSLLLKLAVERQVSSIEPAGFCVWSDNDYRFFTPMGLIRHTEKSYKESLSKLGELHQQMRNRLETYYEKTLLKRDNRPMPNISDVLMPVTPLAALGDFQAVLSPRSAERLSRQLLASDVPELRWNAQQIYMTARQVWPSVFKQPLETVGNPEPINVIVTKLAEDKLSLNSGDRESAKLLEASPRQEFDLLAESIYPFSSLSLDEISQEVSNWSYQQKYESLKSAASQPLILNKIRYKFDVISDQLTLLETISASALSDVQVQLPSPRFGYEIPPIVEEAGIEDIFMECFDESLKLFSILQRADRDDLTVYATLLGHKLRWQFQADAGSLKLLMKHRGPASYKELLESVKEKAAEVHPLTWDVLLDSQPTAAGSALRTNRIKPAKRRRAKSSRRNDRSDK